MTDQVLRVSFTWLLAGVVGLLLVAMIGGWLGANLFGSRAPLVNEREKLVSTIQEVTVSPNISVTEMLQRIERSVVLIAVDRSEQVVPVATGVVVTNDGLIVTAAKLPTADLVAYDNLGRRTELRRVGRDELFGLEYLRAPDTALTPMDMREDVVPVAYQMMAISRSNPTFRPQVNFFNINEVILPPQLVESGIQQMWRGVPINDAKWAGSPLVDDEGRLSGLVVNPRAGLALPVNQLRHSLKRVTGGKREFNPLRELGLSIHYTFVSGGDGAGQLFAVEISKVESGSIAAEAGLRQGDTIVEMADRELDWERVIMSELGRPLPLSLEVIRNGERLNLTLEDNS